MTKSKLLGEKYIIDGRIEQVDVFDPDMSADIYYEVIRMIDGKFLFLNDHLERLEQSVTVSGLNYPGHRKIKEHIQLLRESNPFQLGNIRVCFQHRAEKEDHLLCYFIPYSYPGPSMYKSGVQLVTFPHERPRPGVKKWDDPFRSRVARFIREHGVYEVILQDSQKQLTEGSRSNLFFIDQEDRVITAPARAVLPGITRKYVLQLCSRLQLDVVERPIKAGEINLMPACFISGTSPKILPVRQLDGVQFRVDHSLLNRLMTQFDILVRTNLQS